MYYGYNDKKELILADKNFIELLGYATFNELSTAKIIDSITFENNKLEFLDNDKKIAANFKKSTLYMSSESLTFVELSNVIETNSNGYNIHINYQPIYLDVEKISQEIGLSVDDYKLYLDSFIDQSIIDEQRLQDGDDKVVKNLSNLALTLKIPNINILLLKIKKLPKEERLSFVDEYYSKLALLTLKRPTNIHQSEMQNLLEKDLVEKEPLTIKKKEEELNSTFTELLSNVESKDINNINSINGISSEEEMSLDFEELNKPQKLDLDLDNDLELFNLEETEKPTATPIQENQEKKEAKFTLDNVRALPINYNPKIAADELNLPVVLIEEFVEDFIEQAHHDKDHLLTSYHQKDLDNIHELGHKLKGAASNLRINELADVLEEIQFSTDYTKLESLFKKYWGLFISLEDYMKQRSTI
ncbi:MAG: Hpt domain-containing protein [Sulfurovaceae bacterium]|nr:Hpt domain-containing protein [Sulfurovaceae bacterium]